MVVAEWQVHRSTKPYDIRSRTAGQGTPANPPQHSFWLRASIGLDTRVVGTQALCQELPSHRQAAVTVTLRL